MNIKDYIKENVLIFDGAMGTMLQKLGLKISDLPEELNILEPEKIINIYRSRSKGYNNQYLWSK